MNYIYIAFVKILTTATLLMLLTVPISAETISPSQLTTAPILDGSDNDWKDITPIIVQLNKSSKNVTVEIPSLSVKAGVFKEYIYMFIQWEDSTKDDQHKPFIWNTSQNKYISGEQKEDRLAVQFEMEGDYTVDWMSGQTFKADMWHWKAARSNPLNLIQDKMTIIGKDQVKKAFKMTGGNGQTIYIQRPSDKGDKFYTTKRYSSKEKDMMPKYILAPNPQGSIADIQCKGVWKDGKWNLEVQRKLNTGHSDDVVFSKGKAVKAGFAVFNHSGDDNHVISDTLTFQF